MALGILRFVDEEYDNLQQSRDGVLTDKEVVCVIERVEHVDEPMHEGEVVEAYGRPTHQ